MLLPNVIGDLKHFVMWDGDNGEWIGTSIRDMEAWKPHCTVGERLLSGIEEHSKLKTLLQTGTTKTSGKKTIFEFLLKVPSNFKHIKTV